MSDVMQLHTFLGYGVSASYGQKWRKKNLEVILPVAVSDHEYKRQRASQPAEGNVVPEHNSNLFLLMSALHESLEVN